MELRARKENREETLIGRKEKNSMEESRSKGEIVYIKRRRGA